MVNASNSELLEAHLSLAATQAQQGKLAEASASYVAAISLDPSHIKAHNELACLLGRQGKLDEASICLRTLLALAPNHSDAHCNLGNVLMYQGKLEEAAVSFRKAIALNPNHMFAYSNLGLLLERQGKLGEASASFQKAIAINPSYVNAHTNLGFLLVKLGQVDDGIASCRRALAIRPEDVKAYEALGLAYQCKGQPKEASSYLKKAVALGSADPMTIHLLAAVTGDDAGPTPPDVVRSLFDDYASQFDSHLVGTLAYSAPKLMRNTVDRFRNGRNFRHALDLGCGTGLVGTQFKDIVAEIDGVDLSPRMVELARSKQIYRKLDCEEFVAWLEHSARESLCFDMVLSADVFIYVGNLEPAFRAIRSILDDDGLFVFSVEYLAQGSFQLLPSCRYAHSNDYVRELASKHGFVILASEQVSLRKEKDAIIDGTIFLMK